MDEVLNTMRLHYRGSLFVAALLVLIWIGIKFMESYAMQMILPELINHIKNPNAPIPGVLAQYLNSDSSYGSFIWHLVIPLPIYGFFALLLMKNLELQIKEKIIFLTYGGHWFWVFLWSIICAPVVMMLFLFNGFKITEREL